MPENPDHTNDINSVYACLLGILQQHPDGLSEYELFAVLNESGLEIFDKSAFSDEHTLFCRHFILFHALYRLRDELLASQQYLLDISALNICLLPWVSGQDELVRHDPLRRYYLNMIELEKTSPADTAHLLGRFWARYYSQEGRGAALQVLGLEDPVDSQAIRKQYRLLAMQHHPDRGGDTEQFQEINAAMRLLEPSL